MTTRISTEPGNVHNRWHPDLRPIARIAPGEAITLETRDGLDGQLDRSSTAADLATVRFGRSHPLTGPVYVEGAEPGDLLEVEILGYELPRLRDHGLRPRRRLSRRRVPGAVPRRLGARGRVRAHSGAAGRRDPGRPVRRRARHRAVAGVDGAGAGARGGGSRPRRFRRRRTPPRTRGRGRRQTACAPIPPRENGRQPRHPPARRRLEALPSGRRRGRALLRRRPALRAGRRRGLHQRDRDRRCGDCSLRRAQEPAMAAALCGLRDAGRDAARVVRIDGHPARRRRHQRGARPQPGGPPRPPRADRLPRARARADPRGRIHPLQRRGRPADLRGRRRAEPARLSPAAARRVRAS